MTASVVLSSDAGHSHHLHSQHIDADIDQDDDDLDFEATDREAVLAITEIELNDWPLTDILSELVKIGFVDQEEINHHMLNESSEVY